MKRMVSLLLSAVLLLSACSAADPASTPGLGSHVWTAGELVDRAFDYSGGMGLDGLEYLQAEWSGEGLTVYIENAYGLQDPWEDAAVLRATGASSFEIAVLRTADEGSAVRAATALMSYISSRQGDFAGYAPDEANMVARGSIMQIGPYAGLFICPDPDGAYEAVKAALDGEPIPGPGDTPGQDRDAAGLRDLLVSDQGMDGMDLEKLDGGDQEALRAYMEDAYGLSQDQWEECAIARGTGDSAFEIAVLRMPQDWDIIGEVERRLNSYLDTREAEFDSVTDQAKMLHRALVIEASPYVVLLACEDALGAAGAFSDAAGTMGYGYSQRYRYLDTDPGYPDRCMFTPPNEDDMSIYDTSTIRSAWEKGDPSGLAGYDREIYDAAKKVLDKVLKGGMNDYEKELAIYKWVVNNVNYDWTHQDRMKETPRESFTPYGGLVNHKAICLGYATTFQLLCDLAGVECITVVGAAHMSSSDHGWNMVRLNGEWYCVDATWDANYREQGGRGRPEDWDYFNVTSEEMADSDHQWDYANTPEATAADHGNPSNG